MIRSRLFNFNVSLILTKSRSLWKYTFNYFNGACSEPEWDYGCGSDIGPSEWSELSQEWSLCSTGTQQSPIKILSFDITKNEVTDYMQEMHHPTPATVVNDGNLIRVSIKLLISLTYNLGLCEIWSHVAVIVAVEVEGWLSVYWWNSLRTLWDSVSYTFWAYNQWKNVRMDVLFVDNFAS